MTVKGMTQMLFLVAGIALVGGVVIGMKGAVLLFSREAIEKGHGYFDQNGQFEWKATGDGLAVTK